MPEGLGSRRLSSAGEGREHRPRPLPTSLSETNRFRYAARCCCMLPRPPARDSAVPRRVYRVGLRLYVLFPPPAPVDASQRGAQWRYRAPRRGAIAVCQEHGAANGIGRRSRQRGRCYRTVFARWVTRGTCAASAPARSRSGRGLVVTATPATKAAAAIASILRNRVRPSSNASGRSGPEHSGQAVG